MENKTLEEIDIFEEDKKRKRTLVLGVLIVAVVCIIVVVAVLVSQSLRNDELSAEETDESETVVETKAPVVADTSIPFTLCKDEEILSLSKSYFDARLSADSSAIYTLFGRSDTSSDDSLQKRLEVQAGWIQAFNDITVYTVPGTTSDELLCLVTYVIDFRRTDAMAPGVMYFFAEKTSDGSYYIAETLPKEKVDYAKAFLSADSASVIINSVDDELSQSLASDSTLALIYTSFLSGDIYTEADLELEQEPDVEVVFDAADSVLVGESDLARMSAEAADAASREAQENAIDSSIAQSEAESASMSAAESSAEEAALEQSSLDAEESTGGIGPGYSTVTDAVTESSVGE